MPGSRTLVFESYRLDLGREQLRHGEDVIQLTNKVFAVLRYLVEHAEQLVTRDALMEAVWPNTFVSDAALAVCIHELRQALGETAQAPRFIETVRGRGYRFLTPVTAAVPTPTQHEVIRFSSPQPSSSHPQSVELVGREAQLRQLHQGLVTALQGERQLVFITGEAGIGKTTLVETFLAQIAHDETLWIAYGQCIEQYGAGEAYLPLLEALGRLCRAPEGGALVELLRQEAPSWLLQMPALCSSDEFDALQRRSGGVTRERMLRELAEVVERLTADRPFVLVLEDLHWSDHATLDWLAYVARRRD
ncbi:MAG: AAA family ATPase, partial [Candidatus Tectomicrobia bacterium]|nr:AAA family ATPase [Candidatus Tectomicrobia bacterium]